MILKDLLLKFLNKSFFCCTFVILPALYSEHIGMKLVNTRTLGERSFMYDLVRDA